MTPERCKRCGRKVPWYAWGGNLFLTIYKVTVGILGGSPALIADGLHSFTDVIGTSVILVSTRVSGRPADDAHHYGYGKAEFMSSMFIYIVLIGISLFIFGGGLLLLISGHSERPHAITFFGGLISIIYNVIMYRMGQCAGRRTNSPALLANSFENRADAISSVAVCIGILLAITVHPFCDPIAAMVVGVIIFINCVTEMRKAMGGLMDKSLSPRVVRRIRQVVREQNGVAGVTFVRSRSTGGGYWLDLGIEVKRGTPVTRAQEIAAEVKEYLLGRSKQLEHVEIYVEADAPA